MSHYVWNLGSLTSAQRIQPRQFVAGVEPAQRVVIGRRREPKPMLVIEDAWISVQDFDVASEDFNGAQYNLALGKDPLNNAKLLPVGAIYASGTGAANPNSFVVKDLFKAHGTMWAARYIAIDFREIGNLVVCNADVHADISVAFVDWWTWFISWNDLEAPPDGSLVDGDRSYA